MDRRTRLDRPESGMIEPTLMSKRIADDIENQCCEIGIFILDPNFFHPGSQFLDPESNNNNKRGGGKLFGLTFF
jgi:hypothetical protein